MDTSTASSLERAALEQQWLTWARTFLVEGDVAGAVNALRHAAISLAAHDAIHERITTAPVHIIVRPRVAVLLAVA